MKKAFLLVPLAVLLFGSAAQAAPAATASSLVVAARIPIEWSQGWADGGYFVRSIEAQYGVGSAQSKAIFQAEIDAWLGDGTFNDLDDYGKGYVYRLQRAV